MSEDDELKRRIGDAHRDDAPPPFAAIVKRKPRRRPWLLATPVMLAVAAALALLLLRPTTRPLPSLYVESRGPLDFLLQTPGGDLLRGTPHFDQEGAIP